MNTDSRTDDFDVIIIGGGSAGLSAALLLGRACKRVLVCDAGKPRNQVAHATHGFFSRNGIAREQLHPYDGVEIQVGEVVDAQFLGNYPSATADAKRTGTLRDRFQVTPQGT